ncbi:hypothetical protein BD410DRAFT_808474 [Rickenella mellea]|uniref:Uncharacterized protein n=1 Tax=Rickenella mellea TaxID=50990 RepID=A0A4Y7PLW3_9AGAM|nr:hypothetical protein BD410DRAFT_808474 [Rickenella mellea]
MFCLPLFPASFRKLAHPRGHNAKTNPSEWKIYDEIPFPGQGALEDAFRRCQSVMDERAINSRFRKRMVNAFKRAHEDLIKTNETVNVGQFHRIKGNGFSSKRMRQTIKALAYLQLSNFQTVLALSVLLVPHDELLIEQFTLSMKMAQRMQEDAQKSFETTRKLMNSQPVRIKILDDIFQTCYLAPDEVKLFPGPNTLTLNEFEAARDDWVKELFVYHLQSRAKDDWKDVEGSDVQKRS